LPLLLNFGFQHAIFKVKEKQVGVKLKWKYQLPAHADYVNLLGENIDIIEKITETLISASKNVDLEGSSEKTKYVLLSCHHNVGQNKDLKRGNIFLKYCAVQLFWNDSNKIDTDSRGN
jgi:hypothetical protein